MKTLRIQGYERLFDNKELLLSKNGQNILEQTRNLSLLFECLCQGNQHPLGMHVRRIKAKNGYYYTIVRNKNTMDKHHKNCFNYSTIEHKKAYESSRSISFPVESHIDKKMYILAENLLYNAWCEYINKNQEVPNIEKLFKTIYNTKFIVEHKNTKISINDIIFKPFGNNRYENIDKTLKKAYYRLIKSQQEMYLLVKIEIIQPYEDGQKAIIRAIEPQKKNYFHLIIEDRQFRENAKNLPNTENWLLSATLKDNGESYLTVDKFSIVPATKEGIVVVSKEEEMFITHLNRAKVLYKKPPRTINRYQDIMNQGYNPLFVLYDKEEMKEATIAEIYGYNETIAEDKNLVNLYWQKINKRIEFFKSLENYNYFYWLYHKNPLPIIYQPKVKR